MMKAENVCVHVIEWLTDRKRISTLTTDRKKISNSSQWLNGQTAHPTENKQNSPVFCIPNHRFLTAHLIVGQPAK